MGEENYNLISSDTFEFKLKFKLVELFENAKIIMAKKQLYFNFIYDIL